MDKDIKLITFDVDGTIISDDQKVLEENKEIIKKLKARGVKIVLCTGRSFNGFHRVRQDLGLTGFDDYSISCTGAFIRQNATGKALIKKVLTKKEAEKIIARLDDDRIDVTIHTRDILYNQAKNPNDHFLKDQTKMGMPWLRYENLSDIDTDLARVCFEGDIKVLDEFEKRHKEEIKKDYKYMRNDRNILEVLNKDAGKSEALRDLSHILDLDMDEIMYFGDGVNDIKSMEAVGVAVAMENAREITKEAADYIIGDNNSPSIAEFLKEYFDD